jgi:hypothetical protein
LPGLICSGKDFAIILKILSVSYFYLVILFIFYFTLILDADGKEKTSDSSPSSSPSKIGTSGEYVPYKAPWYSMPSYDTIMRNIKDTEIKQQVLDATHTHLAVSIRITSVYI